MGIHQTFGVAICSISLPVYKQRVGGCKMKSNILLLVSKKHTVETMPKTV
jgi:hypothetical protein